MKCSKVAFDKFRSDKAKGERQSCALDGPSVPRVGQPHEQQKLGMKELDVGSGSSSLVPFLPKMPTPGWATGWHHAALGLSLTSPSLHLCQELRSES